jgi:hypothetical protein
MLVLLSEVIEICLGWLEYMRKGIGCQENQEQPVLPIQIVHIYIDKGRGFWSTRKESSFFQEPSDPFPNLALTPTYPRSESTFNLDDYGRKGSITMGG